MSDERLVWEEHTLDVEQLDLFAPEIEATPRPVNVDDQGRVYQLTELPGSTWEDLFAQPDEAA